ncbi:hypothetical protein RB600_003369 [Gaeumannomyces tritici]
MNAQVSFLDGELSLIHIPLDLYSSLLQPILQVLLPQRESLWPGNRARLPDDAAPAPDGVLGRDHRHGFLNVSVTPVECSVVCHASWVAAVFEPAIGRLLPREAARRVSVSRDRYVALCVINAGMDAGCRVVDLSSPLALAGIPIFFITTYYSDFILVPSKDRRSVVAALLAGGFEFSSGSDSSFVSPLAARGGGGGGGLQTAPHSRAGSSSSRSGSSGSSGGVGHGRPFKLEPGSPVPHDAEELQARTFDLLRRRRVEPRVDPDLHLIHCSGHETSTRQLAGEISVGLMNRPSLNRLNTGPKGSGGGGLGGGGDGGGGGGGGGGAWFGQNGGGHNSHDYHQHSQQPQQQQQQTHTWADAVDTRLYACLVAALASRPRFLSVTLAQDDPPSLLLDKTLLPLFGDSVMGYTEGDLVPIFLDLAALPFEATGIVSGVAGRVVREMVGEDEAEAARREQALNSPLLPELSYLSTARAGAVILPREQSEKALEILRPLLVKK